VGARGEGPERLPDRGDIEGGGISPEDPFGLRAAHAPRRRFPVRLAVATGLLAAVIGAGVVTASELAIFGHSVGSSGHKTSLWGGKTHKSKSKQKSEQASPTPTPSATATTTASPTPTPSATQTPAPSATTSPQQAAPTPTAPAPTATP
jgi:hypothetical protein